MKYFLVISVLLTLISCSREECDYTCSVNEMSCENNNLYKCEESNDGCNVFNLVKTCENSCNEDKKSCKEEEKNKCNNSCKDWQSCNELTASCELKENMCNENKDCVNWKTCNKDNHSCELKENMCNENKDCVNWKTCNKDNHSCELKENMCDGNKDCTNNNEFCDKDKKKCVECNDNFNNCSQNASCVENFCKCDNGFHKNNTECIKDISCKVSPKDSDSNFDGRIYLEISIDTNNENFNEEISELKFLMKKIEEQEFKIVNKVVGPYEYNGKFRYYTDFDENSLGEYLYYASFVYNNENIKCDVDGNDNNPDNNVNFSESKLTKIKVECLHDGACDNQFCITGRCENKAKGDDICKIATFNGHEYKFCGFKDAQNLKNWKDSQIACQNMNAKLVSIENKRENEWLSKNLDAAFSWIGLNDINNEANTSECDSKCAKTSSNWKWENEDSNLDPKIGGYHSWSFIGTPNNQNDADCVSFRRYGEWKDKECSEPYHYVCESE